VAHVTVAREQVSPQQLPCKAVHTYSDIFIDAAAEQQQQEGCAAFAYLTACAQFASCLRDVAWLLYIPGYILSLDLQQALQWVVSLLDHACMTSRTVYKLMALEVQLEQIWRLIIADGTRSAGTHCVIVKIRSKRSRKEMSG
jgi:hypothetical protein